MNVKLLKIWIVEKLDWGNVIWGAGCVLYYRVFVGYWSSTRAQKTPMPSDIIGYTLWEAPCAQRRAAQLPLDATRPIQRCPDLHLQQHLRAVVLCSRALWLALVISRTIVVMVLCLHEL